MEPELKIGSFTIGVKQGAGWPAWVRLRVNDDQFQFRPEEFSMLLDFLNSFRDHIFKPEEK